MKPDQADTVEWHNDSSVSLENGWGLVVVAEDVTLYSYGVVPRDVLDKFRKRKQYIFLLESLAQCLILWFFSPELGPFFLSFCDNTGSHFSLIKGMSKDPEVNALVGIYWAVSGILGVDPWIEVVPTKAQLADAVSRQDVSEATLLGWKYVPMDLTVVWRVLIEACVSPTMNYDSFAHEILTAANTVRAAAGLRPIEGVQRTVRH